MTAPIRWKDAQSDAAPELRSVLREAASRGPSEAQMAALTARIKAELAPVTIPRIPQAAPVSGTKLLPWLTSSVLALALAWTLSLTSSPPAQHPESAAVSRTPPASLKTPSPVAQQANAPTDQSEPVMPEAAPRAKRAHRISLGRAPATAEQPRLHQEDELALLQGARRLQSSAAPKALAALQRHEHMYPNSMFREERETLWIELLIRMGQSEQARDRASAFLSRYPQSAYRARVAPFLAPATSCEPAGGPCPPAHP